MAEAAVACRVQKAGSHPGSMDGSRHDAHIPLDYTFNVHTKDTNGDGAPYPIRNDSTGSFPEDFPGDSPYGSVGGSLVRTRSLPVVTAGPLALRAAATRVCIVTCSIQFGALSYVTYVLLCSPLLT